MRARWLVCAVTATVAITGCDIVIGLDDNRFDRELNTGGAGETGGGESVGGGSVGGGSVGGGSVGGGGPGGCQTIAWNDFRGGSCDGISPCIYDDDFTNREATRDRWEGLFIASDSVDHMQVCESASSLRLEPQALGGGMVGMGLAWTGALRAGSLYANFGPRKFAALMEVEPGEAETAFQGAGLSIYSDNGHWMLLSLTSIGEAPQTIVDGIQLFYYRNDMEGLMWPAGQGPPETPGGMVAALDPEAYVARTVNQRWFLGACRADAGWFFYEGASPSGMLPIEIFEDVDYLTGPRPVKVGPTAHNFNNQSPFEARAHRVHIVEDNTLGDETDCTMLVRSLGAPR